MSSAADPSSGLSSPTRPANVTDLDLWRRRAAAESPAGLTPMPADEHLRAAADHWERVLAAAGLDFTTPHPPGAVLKLVTAELERLVGGLLFVREGGGPKNLTANPEAGMDPVSAMECVALLRELGAVAQSGQACGKKA